MKQTLIIIILALVAAVAGAAPVAVGGDVVTGTSVDPSVAEMAEITADGWINLDRTGAGWKELYAHTDGSATVYVYMAAADGEILRRWGPMLLRDWLAPLRLVPVGSFATDIQFEDVTGSVILATREG